MRRAPPLLRGGGGRGNARRPHARDAPLLTVGRARAATCAECGCRAAPPLCCRVSASAEHSRRPRRTPHAPTPRLEDLQAWAAAYGYGIAAQVGGGRAQPLCCSAGTRAGATSYRIAAAVCAPRHAQDNQVEGRQSVLQQVFDHTVSLVCLSCARTPTRCEQEATNNKPALCATLFRANRFKPWWADTKRSRAVCCALLYLDSAGATQVRAGAESAGARARGQHGNIRVRVRVHVCAHPKEDPSTWLALMNACFALPLSQGDLRGQHAPGDAGTQPHTAPLKSTFKPLTAQSKNRQAIYVANMHLEGHPERTAERLVQARNALSSLARHQESQGLPPEACNVGGAGGAFVGRGLSP